MDQDIVLENGGSFGMPEIGNEKARAIDNKITIGEKLFQARHALTGADDIEKLSVEKISSELCIRPHLLAALEQDDFTKFPSACYAAGFLKNYAAYLGLDVAQIVTQYKKELQQSLSDEYAGDLNAINKQSNALNSINKQLNEKKDALNTFSKGLI